MRRKHATYGHFCVCGRRIFGNGGWSSHKRACRKFARVGVLHEVGGSLAGLPVVQRFPWDDLDGGYEFASAAPDLVVLDREGAGDYRVVRLPETVGDLLDRAKAAGP